MGSKISPQQSEKSELTIRKSILERKFQTYFGHIVRRNRGVEKQILQGAAEGRGRPPISWTDDVKEATSHGVYGATILASDRGKKRTLVKTTAAQLDANRPKRENKKNIQSFLLIISMFMEMVEISLGDDFYGSSNQDSSTFN